MLTLVLGLLGGVGSLDLENGKRAWFGSAARTSSPAAFDYGRVEAATAEAVVIRREGVRRGSARHALLRSRLRARIGQAAAEIARAAGHDCVVAARDIANPNGLTVADVTGEMVAAVRRGS